MISLLPPELILIIIDLTIEVEIEESKLRMRMKKEVKGYGGNRFRLVCMEWNRFLRNKTFYRIKISGSNELNEFIKWFKGLNQLEQPKIFEFSIEWIRNQTNEGEVDKVELINFEELICILNLIGEDLICLQIKFDSYELISMELIQSFQMMKNLLALSFTSNSSDRRIQSNQITKSLLDSISSFTNLRSLHLNNYLYHIENIPEDLIYQFPSIVHFQFDDEVDLKLLIYLINSIKLTLKSLSIKGPISIGKLKPLFQSIQNQLELIEFTNIKLTKSELLNLKMNKLRVIKFNGSIHEENLIQNLNSPFFKSCQTLQLDLLSFDFLNFDLNLITKSFDSSTQKLKIICLLIQTHDHDDDQFFLNSYSKIQKRLDKLDQVLSNDDSKLDLIFPDLLTYHFPGHKPTSFVSS
ncbi:hypothetical protein DFH28DRAFT_1106773 [Melampsora americana]|nr:hypothetical protein DFH28DRAFT_1106773 [Melampsora americana]